MSQVLDDETDVDARRVLRRAISRPRERQSRHLSDDRLPTVCFWRWYRSGDRPTGPLSRDRSIDRSTDRPIDRSIPTLPVPSLGLSLPLWSPSSPPRPQARSRADAADPSTTTTPPANFAIAELAFSVASAVFLSYMAQNHVTGALGKEKLPTNEVDPIDGLTLTKSLSLHTDCNQRRYTGTIMLRRALDVTLRLAQGAEATSLKSSPSTAMFLSSRSRFHASVYSNSPDEHDSKIDHTRSSVAAASGMDPIQRGRKLTIYSLPKTAMQSGSAQTLQGGAPAWRIVAEVESKWTNPLQGWTSTADPLETTLRQLTFFSAEAAAAYCDKMGYKYEIEAPVAVNKSVRPKRFQGYGANFDVKRLKGGAPIGGLRSEQGTK